MPRPATGSVVEKTTKRGTVYALRFRAYGERRYITLGTRDDGWDAARAEKELRHVLADVDRGIWQPPDAAPVVETVADPGFHAFASEWLASRRPELAPATAQAYRNELVHHLLPFFAGHTLRQITVAEVDRYREAKMTAYRRWADLAALPVPTEERAREAHEARVSAARSASPVYINATITRLGAILDVADERGLIDRNPVRVNPRNRKAKVKRTSRAYLDRPEQIVALVDAAGQLDAEAGQRRDRDTCLRRPLIATLVFAGLRISEALALRWRDVDLAGCRLRVADSKTDAGVRWVPMLPVLRDELIARKTSTKHADPTDLVFSNLKGRALSRDNTRTRVLGKAHEIADERLEEHGFAPLPERLTQHSLRHTYVSLRVAVGDDPATIARDAGHADMGVTFRIYTHVMALREGDKQALRSIVAGTEWAPLGTSAVQEPSAA